MRRKIFAGFLGIAGVLAISAGFVAHRHHGGFYGRHAARHAEFENHIAEVCTRAAEKVARERAPERAAPAP